MQGKARSFSPMRVSTRTWVGPTLGVGQRAIPAGLWFAGVMDAGHAGDGGPVARWRRYADRRFRGEE